jgi:hypothetical protein
MIVFLYIHITYQYKKGEDLEIYEADYTSNSHLQEICNVKQPLLFQFKFDELENLTPENIAKMAGSHDCKVKDTNDYYDDSISSVDYVVFPFQTAQKLFKRDAKSHYYTEKNETFVEDSGLIKNIQEVDDFLKPKFCIQTKYDLLCGSTETGLPLRYHTNDRVFLIPTSGKIRIKMTPWKSRKYLHTIRDFEKYEFRSPVNVWKPQKKYDSDIEKLRFLEFDVLTNHVLYVPPYWYYSIQLTENTCVASITYNTLMNIVAHAPKWGRYFIQQQNIQKKIAKTLDINAEMRDNEESTNTMEEIDVSVL